MQKLINLVIRAARKWPVRYVGIGLVGVWLCLFNLAALAEQDVVLVLDASSHMHTKAAPVAQLVSDFTNSRGPDTHIAVIAYDNTAKVLVPLTPISDNSRQQVETALRKLNYSGQASDMAAGLGRGLAEILDRGNVGAQKSIVLITDDSAAVNTSNATHNETVWIMQSLVPTAIYNRVRIYGITFKIGTAYKFLQSIGLKTGGGAFRVGKQTSLEEVFKQMNADMTNIGSLGLQFPQSQLVPLPPPALGGTKVPVQFKTPLTSHNSGSPRVSWLWLIGLMALLAAAFGIYIAWNIMRHVRLPKRASHSMMPGGEGPRAVLYDISNPNDIKRYELTERSTLIGRVAGYDPEVQYVLVKEKTVGRCHAVIERRGHSFWIMDQGSINGTFVNGERITTDRALKHGDIVAIHRHEFEFMIPEYFESESTVIGMREQPAG